MVYFRHMETTDDKAKKLRAAYDEFMAQMRSLEHDRLEVMKRVIGDLEKEEIEKILKELKP